MASWSFLTNHARVLLCIARDPGARLRDIAASLGITERSAHGIVTDLAEAGYVIRQKDGRRNLCRFGTFGRMASRSGVHQDHLRHVEVLVDHATDLSASTSRSSGILPFGRRG